MSLTDDLIQLRRDLAGINLRLNNIRASGGMGSIALDDLSDVVVPAPNDDDVLTWDAVTSKWINAVAAGGASAFTDLSDVPGVYAVGDALKLVRVNAIHTGLEFGGAITISAASASGGNDGDIWLKY
jgi:hypothetical protein